MWQLKGLSLKFWTSSVLKFVLRTALSQLWDLGHTSALLERWCQSTALGKGSFCSSLPSLVCGWAHLSSSWFAVLAPWSFVFHLIIAGMFPVEPFCQYWMWMLCCWLRASGEWFCCSCTTRVFGFVGNCLEWDVNSKFAKVLTSSWFTLNSWRFAVSTAENVKAPKIVSTVMRPPRRRVSCCCVQVNCWGLLHLFFNALKQCLKWEEAE